jgi:hypothetical protein
VPKARQTQPTSYVRRNENEIERHLPVADNGSKQICRRTKVGRNLGVMVEGRKTWRVNYRPCIDQPARDNCAVAFVT